MDETDVQIKARAFIAPLDTSNVRTDLNVYVVAANAKLRREELGKDEAGFTSTKPNGQHVITTNSSESESRQRFTICHEIAHIVLGLESQHDEVPPGSYAKRDINEVWCDIFAAELLMPLKMWRDKLSDEEPSEALIHQMADEFGASFPAAASRYATLADHPCALVTMEKGTVRYAARSTPLRNARAWITPKSPIPVGSVAHALREAGLNATDVGVADQDVWFENWESGLELSELSRHYQKSDTTIALLWFSNEDLREIEVDRFGKQMVDDGGLAELTGELPWPGKRGRR
jgi:Zn-dependent peptidase ImmA (M78 family)